MKFTPIFCLFDLWHPQCKMFSYHAWKESLPLYFSQQQVGDEMKTRRVVGMRTDQLAFLAPVFALSLLSADSARSVLVL